MNTMMNQLVIVIVAAIMMSQCVQIASADCYKMAGCVDPKTGQKRNEGDSFVVVDENQMSCSGCVCAKNRRYVASCMTLRVVNITTPIRKAGLYKRIADPFHERMTATFAKDEEMELTEEEASVVKCEPEYVPEYDSENQMLEFRFIHYFFSTWETYCCTKTPAYGNVHPYCTVKFDKKCRTRAVMREKPHLPCRLPFNMRG